MKWSSNDNFTLMFEKIHKSFTATQALDVQTSAEDHVGDSSDARPTITATHRVTDPITVYGVLTYTDISQLTSKRTYTGIVDSMNFTINFDNGPIIEGQANFPGVMPSVPFTGYGIWHDI